MSKTFTLGEAQTLLPVLEALLKRDDLSIEFAPLIKQQIEHLKNPSPKGKDHAEGEEEGEGESDEQGPAKGSEDQKISHLEQLVEEMNERLKAIESRLPPKP